MKVEFQHLTSLLRVWLTPEAEYGEPYPWAAMVRWIDKDSVEFLGVTKPITPEMWKAIQDASADTGIQTILAVRYTAGKKRERWIPTARRGRMSDGQADVPMDFAAFGYVPSLGWGKRAFIAIDQALNVFILNGEPDETVSARSYRLRAHPLWGLLQRTLDRAFFWQVEHCRMSYEWEHIRGDLPDEYQTQVAPQG